MENIKSQSKIVYDMGDPAIVWVCSFDQDSRALRVFEQQQQQDKKNTVNVSCDGNKHYIKFHARLQS